MNVIGLIGGMSWESTVEYYRIANEAVKERLGGFHSAKILLYSVEFHEVEACIQSNRWDDAARILIDAARRLEQGGADCILIGTNTMHRVFDAVQAAVDRPLLHIADATAAEAKRLGLSRLGLLGTRATMELDFLKGRLSSTHGLEALTPDQADRDRLHDIIFNELCLGKVLDGSRNELLRMIGDLQRRGAEGIILGCTELPLLVRPGDTSAPLLDTTALHALAAVDWALR